MRILIIHQNFPGQFRQLLPLLEAEGHDLRAIFSHQRPIHGSLTVHRYPAPDLANVGPTSISGLAFWAEGLSRAPQVAHIATQWSKEGWVPDLILGHSGWGETLLMRNVFPNVPIVIWPELWVQAFHAGIQSPPLGPGPSLLQQADHMSRNSLTRAALSTASAWVLPTSYQAKSFPTEYQDDRMHIIHEGINVNVACPNPEAKYEVRGIPIDRSVPTITFVNRNLETLRGFDSFMRSLPRILSSHSTVRIIVVGDNGHGYAGYSDENTSLKKTMLEELDGQLDLDRIHFLGRIPYECLLAVLQASWVHVYLTQPFILGWSLLEAMACGCTLVGSKGMPVSEVLKHEKNALLVDIKSPDLLARSVLDLLSNSSLRSQLSSQARLDSLLWDQTVMWPKFKSLFQKVVSSA